jgi:signal transduction histidine kinase
MTYETFLSIVHPDDRQYVDTQWKAGLRGEPYDIEHRIVVGHQVKWVREKAYLEFDNSGELLGGFGITQDITERKRAEEALRQRTIELQHLTETLDQQVKERTEELSEANKTLRQLSTRLLSAQEDERRRIAGELHDTIGSCLSGVKFKIEDVLQQVGKAPTVVGESLSTIIPVIQEGIEDCRRLQQDLRPSMLDDLGLLPTLSWFCRRYQTIYAGIKIDLEQTLEESDIPNSLKIVIYRVTQEGLNNIAKHGKADLVHLSLRRMGRMIELSIEDNGTGFDPQSVKQGLGLMSMRERTELSGGTFTMESTIGKGTTIKASWPTLREIE